MVSISGVNSDGEDNMLYCGYVGYVKLNKISFDDMQTLIITPAGKNSGTNSPDCQRVNHKSLPIAPLRYSFI